MLFTNAYDLSQTMMWYVRRKIIDFLAAGTDNVAVAGQLQQWAYVIKGTDAFDLDVNKTHHNSKEASHTPITKKSLYFIHFSYYYQ